VNVLVSHHDPLVAAGIEAVRSRQSDMFVIAGSTSSGRPFGTHSIGGSDPIFVADYETGIEFMAARKASGKQPGIATLRVLVISDLRSRWEARCALKEGIRDCVLRSSERADGVRMLGRGGR
jgi:DNA-binding NarL/FixJ family response regulator